MKNISHFLNFKKLNAPVIQWLTTINRVSNTQPIFCNTHSYMEEKEKSLVLESAKPNDFSKPKSKEDSLPKELLNSFGTSSSYPVFNLNEIESDRILSEILDTDLLLISCKALDEEKGLELDYISSKILNRAKCPVVLIPENVERPSKFDRVVFNSDIRFTELRFVKTIAKLCSTLKSKLTVAHVSDSGIPDLNIEYGKSLFNDAFRTYVSDCDMNLENIKKLDVQKYPDLINDYLAGDIYSMVNKNHHLKEGDFLSSVAIKLSALAKRPLLIVNA